MDQSARSSEASELVEVLAARGREGPVPALAVGGRGDLRGPASGPRRRGRHLVVDLHARQLTPENIEWLKSLPYERREGELTFCHGSPINLEEFEYIFSVEQATRCLDIWDDLGMVTFIGHSHLCKVFAMTPHSVEELPSCDFDLEPNRKYVCSVGSVGQPRDYDNRASYTVYDTEAKRFEFKRIEYDIEAAANKVMRAKLERNFAHRLFIGV